MTSTIPDILARIVAKKREELAAAASRTAEWEKCGLTKIGSRRDLRSDILVKGQHHSDKSGSEDFLGAVQPRLIVATSRDFPHQERIPDEWAWRVQASGIKLFRQDETGAVELEFAESDWQARAYLTGEIFRSANR